MQQFQVPQFINIEDKIIGPFTLKQFLYLLGAAAIAVLGWRFLFLPLFLLIALPVTIFLVVMALGKIDERPFPVVFINALNYFLKPRLYIWKRVYDKKKSVEAPLPPTGEKSPLGELGKLTASKLSDLAWSLDIKDMKDKVER